MQNDTLHKLKDYLNKGIKLGKSSLFRKSDKYYLAVTVSIKPKECKGNNTMGIDIGGNEVNRMFYNGKEAGFVRKKYRIVRRSLGKRKKPKKIEDIANGRMSKCIYYIRKVSNKFWRYGNGISCKENWFR